MASVAATVASANRTIACMGPVSEDVRITIVQRQCDLVLSCISGSTDLRSACEADIMETLPNSVFQTQKKQIVASVRCPHEHVRANVCRRSKVLELQVAHPLHGS